MTRAARPLLVVAATVVMVVVNALANALPLNGQQTGAISDRFAVYFTPAGYVFSIWGLIYLALAAFTVFQATRAGRGDADIDAIAPWYIVSCLANSAWIFLWHYEQFLLTEGAMLVLLASLIRIYLRLDIRRTAVGGAKRWAVHAPFSLYLGWITVATIANTTIVLYRAGLAEVLLTPETWTTVVLVVAVLIAAAVAITRADTIYAGVLVWAFIGIAVKHQATLQVAYSAAVAAAAVALLAIAGLLPHSPLPLAPGPGGRRSPG